MLIRALVMSLVMLGMTTAAHADKFDIAGVGCVPDSKTFHEHKYALGVGTLAFLSNQVGDLQFHCPVPVMPAGPTTMKTRFRAPGTSRVLVQYLKAHKSQHGDYGFIATLLVTGGVPNLTTDTQTFSDVYGNANIYWIKVELHRDSVNDDVRVFTVSLN
jgi:hypothetical protein